jgi:hypothetical protein
VKNDLHVPKCFLVHTNPSHTEGTADLLNEGPVHFFPAVRHFIFQRVLALHSELETLGGSNLCACHYLSAALWYDSSILAILRFTCRHAIAVELCVESADRCAAHLNNRAHSSLSRALAQQLLHHSLWAAKWYSFSHNFAFRPFLSDCLVPWVQTVLRDVAKRSYLDFETDFKPYYPAFPPPKGLPLGYDYFLNLRML